MCRIVRTFKPLRDLTDFSFFHPGSSFLHFITVCTVFIDKIHRINNSHSTIVVSVNMHDSCIMHFMVYSKVPPNRELYETHTKR